MRPDNAVCLATLAGGSAVARVDLALQDLWDNCMDPNTSAQAKRSVVLTITVKPDEAREDARVSIGVHKKLAPQSPVGTRIFLGQDREGCHAVEAQRPPTLPLGEDDPNVTRMPEKGKGA